MSRCCAVHAPRPRRGGPTVKVAADGALDALICGVVAKPFTLAEIQAEVAEAVAAAGVTCGEARFPDARSPEPAVKARTQHVKR
jgi:hypothetical protein